MKPIPYATQWIDDDDIASVVTVLKGANLTQGPAIEKFELKIAEYCGARYAVAVNSGTSALHIACLAAGIQKDDEVITSPNTFAASSNCILYCGGKPVFADISEETAIIDPREIVKKITNKTKAIIPVDFAGHPAEMEDIYSIAKEHKFCVIEDAAHSLGASYKSKSGEWVKVGACQHADMTILSFHPVKLITTGEGGMVVTNNEDLYDKLLFYRSHGITRKPKYLKENHGDWYYEMQRLGFNYRITDIQCALGASQLKKLDKFVARRREISVMYDKAFQNTCIKYFKEREGFRSARHLYVINVENRDRVFDSLRKDFSIIVNVHYLPVYMHPYYQNLGYAKGQCQKAENYYSKAISIPMFPKLTDKEAEYVIEKIKATVEKYA